MLSARNECRSIIVRKARTTLRFEFEGVSTHMRFNIGTLSPAIFLFLVITFSTTAQVQRPESGISIQGTVKSGNTPLPGASVDAINSDSLEQVATTTDLSGRYSLRLPGAGTYLVTAEMTAFMTVDQQVVITDAHTVRADFDLILRSKSQTIAAQPRATLDANRRLSNAPPVEETANETGNGTDDFLVPPGMAIAGMTTDAPTESVAVSGNTAPQTFEGMFDPERLAAQQEGFGERGGPAGAEEGTRGAAGGRFGPAPGAGRGGLVGGGGQRGGGLRGGGLRGGANPFFIGGGRGQFPNRTNINLNYSLGNSAFDASPYSLKGPSTSKPDYGQSRFGVTVGGPLKIPKLFDLGNRNFFTITYNASRTHNPFDAFSTVPTAVERAGDFSETYFRGGKPVLIADPVTGVSFQNNRIPAPSINPAAARLMSFIPLPNLLGNVQNYHYVTTNKDNSNDLNVRFNHSFGASGSPRGRGPRSGFGGGGRGGARGQALTIGIQYRTQDSTVSNPIPSIGGTTSVVGINVPIGYSHSIGRLSNSVQFGFSRNRNTTANLYAGIRNVAGEAGVGGVSQDPFDWGIPKLSFTNYTGVSDLNTSRRINQTLQFGDSMIWARVKHSMRWGVQFRRIQLNTRTNDNARGSFTFTGANAGFDFADFLLGLPQLTSIEYGSNSYQFRANSWNLFFQDDWRILPALTLNLGLRYEYVSPFSETENRIVNLDTASGFTAVAPVLPGKVGAFTGKFPSTLVDPDRNNFGPRVGIAWRAMNNTIVRAGYGINYNNAAYNNIVQQLAFQPPFAVTQTNIASSALRLTLQNGFPVPPPATITNSFGVDRNYRLGYVQTWNLDIQRSISSSVVLNAGYIGTRGTHLDIVEAPNRTATGLRIPNVQPFLWETSEGGSVSHSASVRLRKRLTFGLAAGGNYTFSKSIDNASSTGGGAGVVAQNAFELAAERGLSNFDQTHRFTGDYLWELPFGENKRWLSTGHFGRAILGNWQVSGSWTIASGTPSTARILGDTGDILRGTNGTLRANATGAPVFIANPTVIAWFNTAAFVLPAAGQFGNAGRNTIRGPGTYQFDMALNRSVMLKERYPLELRVQASNVFNTPQFRAIDTIVNSPSFGRVTSVGSMRKIQIIARLRF